MSLWSWVTGARPKSNELVEAEKCFSPTELHDMQQHYANTAAKEGKPAAQTKEAPISDLAFLQGLCCLPPREHLSQRLCSLVKQMGGAVMISQDKVIILKAKLERMGQEESRRTCFALLHGSWAAQQQPLTQEQLREAVASVLRIALKTDTAPDHIVSAITAGALRQASQQEMHAMSLDGYTKWCKVFPAVHQGLRGLMLQVGKVEPTKQPAPLPLPELIIPPHHSLQRLMLQHEWAWALCGCLPADCQQTWQLLFNSQRDGKSFSTFIGRLGELAPTLLLVQDKNGHLFGGFASQPWQKKGTFYGDSGCFIFGLLPNLVVYPATGINDNFQWCGINFSQLPNGVGLGGQVGHYGVYVDSTFDNGISRPIATFANECLASAQTFEVETVECWLLKPPQDDVLEAAGLLAGNTILDRNKEARNFMELAGVKVNQSEGVRMGPPPELEL